MYYDILYLFCEVLPFIFSNSSDDPATASDGLLHVTDRFCGLAVRVLATYPEVPVRFPALPDILRSSGSGTRSTQPREYN
jgi:hypothetical protein